MCKVVVLREGGGCFARGFREESWADKRVENAQQTRSNVSWSSVGALATKILEGPKRNSRLVAAAVTVGNKNERKRKT